MGETQWRHFLPPPSPFLTLAHSGWPGCAVCCWCAADSSPRPPDDGSCCVYSKQSDNDIISIYGQMKGKSHLTIYGHMKGKKSHLTIYGHMKGKSHTLPYMVTWKVKVTPYHIWSYERWKSHLTIYGLLQVYLLCWVSWTLYLSIMDLSVMTSWLHLRSSSSIEEQEVWGV